MRRFVFAVCMFILFSVSAKAQQEFGVPKPQWLMYEGDSAQVLPLRPVHIFALLKFKNNKDRQEYSKLIRDVKVAYPYAKMIAYSIIETYEYMETIPTEKAKQKYLESVQKYLMSEYKPKMKKMTKNQGKILIKLIDRECNTSSYNIVKALVGSLKATFYNTFASIFGNSLKAQYDPNGKDMAIESIVLQIEDGSIDYYYMRNYNSFGKY